MMWVALFVTACAVFTGWVLVSETRCRRRDRAADAAWAGAVDQAEQVEREWFRWRAGAFGRLQARRSVR